MKVMLVAVGNRMPTWVQAGFEEYARRMPPDARLKLVQAKPESRGASTPTAATVARLTEAEGRRILMAIPQNWLWVVLDERGKEWDTRELSVRIASWQMDGRDVAFIIGGADGLHQSVRQRADFLWSLSALTLPHGLVRVITAEQIYRAHSILNNHPYHRD
jgi:23S rRNA (pseudouridine1915-N3)-methyltransferase